MRGANSTRVLASVFFASLALSSPTQAARLSDFELTKLDNWADAVAVCDITRFLMTDPDLSADALIIPGSSNTRIALYKPLFVPPTNFFSQIMRDTYENLRKAGHVTSANYSRARIYYAGQMLGAFGSASGAEKRALVDQMELCYHMAIRAGVKVETKR